MFIHNSLRKILNYDMIMGPGTTPTFFLSVTLSGVSERLLSLFPESDVKFAIVPGCLF